MIAKDQSLFVLMDALCRRRRTEKLLLPSHDVTDRVAASFSNMAKFGYISLLHFFNLDAFVFGWNFSSQSSHLRFHDDTQCQSHLYEADP